MANKNNAKDLFSTPGVGLYNINKLKYKAASKIGYEKRQINIFNVETPGPGNYMSNVGLSNYSYANHKFGNEKRLNEKISNENPGPGSYNVRNDVDSRFS